MTCSRCSSPTPASYGLCARCLAERTAGDREAQGLPVVIEDAGTLRAIVALGRPAALEGVAA